MQTIITTPEGQQITRTNAEDFKVGDRMLAHGGALVTAVEHVPATPDQVRMVLITTRHQYGTSQNLHCAWNSFYKIVA